MVSKDERPIIGVTCGIREASFAKWKMDAAVLPSTYSTAIERAGGIPLLIPPSKYSNSILKIINGIVIAGGPDVDSSAYGQESDSLAGEYFPEQDSSEMALLKGALEIDVPILCICRGMQLLSIIHGGSLYQHLDTTPGYENHGGYDGRVTEHQVIINENTRIGNIMGTEVRVNSTHHQGVSNAGSLTVSAHSAHDGLIEAVERSDLKFCIGVQWHPERMGEGHDILYHELVKSARS
jgi:putative glutamine amidotransferase